ncbi:HNH endonuclease [Desulfospira joergensenii]|uniref:HNH endonuclease n=1 Tax=Desulfospira joergensenii TaxID=53329 RepID=UPI0004879794|nr:HNH endonuclease [Desulfospira joergensenii]
MDPFIGFIDEAVIKKEKAKARTLRAGQWWKRKRSAGICHYCRKSFAPADLTMDHVIPLARGGKSEKYNLVPCCKACNTKKRQLLPAEWKEYMDSLNK